jgi:hypothetical protein
MLTPTIPIISIADNGAFVLASPFVYDTGKRVQILRTISAGSRKRGGFFYVTKTNDLTGIIQAWPYGASFGGKIRLAQATLCPITYQPDAAQTCSAMVKKVGRPFNGYRGRKSAKVPA